MDEIAEFLDTLLTGTSETYKGIAETALSMYCTHDKLTQPLCDWAVRTANIKRVPIPEHFADVEIMRGKGKPPVPAKPKPIVVETVRETKPAEVDVASEIATTCNEISRSFSKLSDLFRQLS